MDASAYESGSDDGNYLDTPTFLLERPSPHPAPINPTYSDVAVRVLSFISMLTLKYHEPKDLAGAGFYYSGHGDHVQCFHCGGRLKNWESNDDPWLEHAHWFPHCLYILASRGEKFITHAKQPGAREMGRNQAPFQQTPSEAMKYRFQAREIKARMDTDIVQIVLNMGYRQDVVRDVIVDRLETTGDDFPSARDLLESILNYEEMPQENKNKKLLSVQEEEKQQKQKILEEKREKWLKEQERKAELAQQALINHQKPPKPKQLPPPSNNTATHPVTQNISTATISTSSPQRPQSEPNESQQGTSGGGESGQLKHQLQQLQHENRELHDKQLCKVCLDKEENVVLLPCAHLCCCGGCSSQLKKCPICRQLIKGTVRIFKS